MADAIALIDEILAEHAAIVKNVEDLDQVVSDTTTLKDMSQADKNFSPGRLNRAEELKKVQVFLERSDKGLQDHFSREETALLEVFKKHGDENLILDFHKLLHQHDEIKERMAHSKKQADQLVSGEIGGGHWNAIANDMMTYMNKTRKLIEEHASGELKLFRTLRGVLEKAK